MKIHCIGGSIVKETTIALDINGLDSWTHLHYEYGWSLVNGGISAGVTCESQAAAH